MVSLSYLDGVGWSINLGRDEGVDGLILVPDFRRETLPILRHVQRLALHVEEADRHGLGVGGGEVGRELDLRQALVQGNAPDDVGRGDAQVVEKDGHAEDEEPAKVREDQVPRRDRGMMPLNTSWEKIFKAVWKLSIDICIKM